MQKVDTPTGARFRASWRTETGQRRSVVRETQAAARLAAQLQRRERG